jgi:hypothetical protein
VKGFPALALEEKRERIEREGRSSVTHDAAALMDRLEGLMMEIIARLPTLFPWVSSLSTADQRTFAIELLQAVHNGNRADLIELLEDWQATAEALNNPGFLQAWRQPERPDDEIPWEQARGELNLPRGPEAGCP